MHLKKMILVDKQNREICEIFVQEYDSERYSGFIKPISFPKKLRSLFSEYQNNANEMVLSVLDDIEDQINLYGLKIKNSNIEIDNLQITEDNKISFRSSSPLN